MDRRELRHGRILNIRLKIKQGWNMKQLENFCKINLKVSKPTIKSYIDEASEPFRKQYQKEQKNDF